MFSVCSRRHVTKNCAFRCHSSQTPPLVSFDIKGQLLFVWTALTHLPLVVDHRRCQLLMAGKRPLTAFVRPNIVLVVILVPEDLCWCLYVPKEQSCVSIDGIQST